MGMGAAGGAARRGVREADSEPVNWIQAEFAANMTAVDYAAALAASYRFRRDVQARWGDGWGRLVAPHAALRAPPRGAGRGVRGGWADGCALLRTPTLAEPPPLLEEFAPVAGDPAAQMRRSA